MKNRLFSIISMMAIGGTLVIACNSSPAQPEAPPAEANPVMTPAETMPPDSTALEAQPQIREETVQTAVEPEPETLREADSPVGGEPVVGTEPPVNNEPAREATDPAERKETAGAANANPVALSATTGLQDFSAYRLRFNTNFEGTRNAQPASGALGGIMEVTRQPSAQHWAITVSGNAFQELALLGGKMEMYDIGETVYIQNPGDGSFIGMPAMFVDSMLPTDVYNPENSIELPATATLQPGTETINGVVTQRYTFGKDDLAGDVSDFDSVAGTIWVAVDGNYVVKYEATISGKFSNLAAGHVEILDEGAITMVYELSDANGDFTISPPAGARAIDLNELLFQ